MVFAAEGDGFRGYNKSYFLYPDAIGVVAIDTGGSPSRRYGKI